MKLENKILDIINSNLKIKEKITNINTQINTIPEWDSLGNVRIIMELENIFNISIQFSEIDELKTIEDIIKLVKHKFPNGI